MSVLLLSLVLVRILCPDQFIAKNQIIYYQYLFNVMDHYMINPLPDNKF